MQRIQRYARGGDPVHVPPTMSRYDAVTLALSYAQVDTTSCGTARYGGRRYASIDWLHLHHEDFTATLGKFFASFWQRAVVPRQVVDSAAVR